MVTLWIVYRIIQKARAVQEKIALETIPGLTIEARAFKEDQKNFNKPEQDTLKTLVYEENQNKKFSIQRVVWVAIITFTTSLVVEVLQEIIQRL